MAKGQESLKSVGVEIRTLHDLSSFFDTVEVQREVWGFSETDQVPPRLFTVIDLVGGLVLGAYKGKRMVGFSLALPGKKPDGMAYLHSHMTAIVPELQNLGLGRALKLRQRIEALKLRYVRIEWTFDPLQIRNAHFNIERLGVIVRRYERNVYGITSSRLEGSLPTDRLVAEWFLDGPRVRSVVEQEKRLERIAAETIAVPEKIEKLRSEDPAQAIRIQTEIRERFEELFAQGLAVVGYRRGDGEGTYELGRLGEQPVGAV